MEGEEASLDLPGERAGRLSAGGGNALPCHSPAGGRRWSASVDAQLLAKNGPDSRSELGISVQGQLPYLEIHPPIASKFRPLDAEKLQAAKLEFEQME
jgi:hypothetical protein